jgi:hypothetical protein
MGKLQFETLALLSLTTDPSAHFVSLGMTRRVVFVGF